VDNEKLLRYHQVLEQINRQRLYWLISSSLVFFLFVLVWVFWNDFVLHNEQWVWWILCLIAVVLSINWWYWTMNYIKKSLMHQLSVVEILSSITQDVQLVKEDVKKLTETVDKSK